MKEPRPHGGAGGGGPPGGEGGVGGGEGEGGGGEGGGDEGGGRRQRHWIVGNEESQPAMLPEKEIAPLG
jgi:hypothetical protein